MELYQKSFEEQTNTAFIYFKSKTNKIGYQINKVMERIELSEKSFEAFENKTDANFLIAEKAIKAHTKFLNEIDARLVIL